MPIEVIKPGLATSVQDLGRPGYYHLGIPQSGAHGSFRVARRQPAGRQRRGRRGAGSTFLGPELDSPPMRWSRSPARRCRPSSTERHARPGPAFAVKAGQVLSFDFLKTRRARLHRGGGRHRRAGGARQPFHLRARRARGLRGPPAAPGRRAAARRGVARRAQRARRCPMRCAGSCQSRPACACCPACTTTASPRRRRTAFSPTPGRWRRRRIASAIASAAAARWNSCRGEQPFGAGSDPSNIVDSCYPYGSIQVPGGTEPIVLHRDAVSGGGYFMIGTVISADMDLIGQMQPHTPTRFVPVDMAQALAARREEAARLARLREALRM